MRCKGALRLRCLAGSILTLGVGVTLYAVRLHVGTMWASGHAASDAAIIPAGAALEAQRLRLLRKAMGFIPQSLPDSDLSGSQTGDDILATSTETAVITAQTQATSPVTAEPSQGMTTKEDGQEADTVSNGNGADPSGEFGDRSDSEMHERELRLLKYGEECAAAAGPNSDFATNQFIKMFRGAQPPSGLRCCALVGSSSSLQGRGQGREIDSYDTVIRVNRIPSPSFYADFGRRADIVFVNDQHWFRPTIPVLGSKDLDCTQAGNCNFTVILSAWQPYPWRDWYNISRFWARAHCHVGHQVDEVADWLRGYLPWQPGKRDHFHASGGLHAFVTMASQCAFTRLFGFGGPQTTVDGHNVSSFHNFRAERDLMEVIGSGDGKKLKTILKKAKQKRQGVPKWLRVYLQKGLRGRIAITEV